MIRPGRCSLCWVDDGTPILRFSLVVQSTTPEGRHTTRGAGAIELCERCWRAATDRSRIRRRPRPRVATG